MRGGALRCLGLCAFALLLFTGQARAATPAVRTAHIDGDINSVTATYISGSVDRAAAEGADALVVLVNTPGGLMTAMDDICTKLLNSRVPVIVYISPAGARAASAGLFVSQAADLVAMAPSTNIGSAHPILSNGTAPTDVLGQKVLNDAVARVRNLASIHGRNADWSERAVRQSVNIGVDEAVRIHVADLAARNLGELLSAVDGRTLHRPHAQDVTLRTAGAQVGDDPMSPLLQLWHALVDPNVAYLLMLVAVYGLIAEVTSPGAILPGTVGVISGVLALVSFASLPVNIAGVILIVFAFALFLADIKAPTHGILTAGGVVALLLGSGLLIDSGPVGLGINPLLIAVVGAGSAISFALVVRKALAARSGHAFVGAESLVGSLGEARDRLAPEGMIFVAGALWHARARVGEIPAGTVVRVVRRDGLVLEVALPEPGAVLAAQRT
jgi:membrane-bound serine protease (ClpP class)